MPLRLDTENRTGTLVAAINEVLTVHGPAGLSLRRIADVSRVSTSSMLHHMGSREHLLRVAADRTGRARLHDILDRELREGPLAFLPNCAEDILDARAWLAWLELWRCEETLEPSITRAREDERATLARMLQLRPDLEPKAIDPSIALIDGLLIALCRPQRPMPRDQARRTLAHHLDLPDRFVDVTPQPRCVSMW